MKVDVPFLSPFTRFDAVAQLVIVEHRDPDTGEVQEQIPSPAALKREEQAALATPAPAPPSLPASAPAPAPTTGGRVSLLV
jgi:hypothetical protein